MLAAERRRPLSPGAACLPLVLGERRRTESPTGAPPIARQPGHLPRALGPGDRRLRRSSRRSGRGAHPPRAPSSKPEPPSWWTGCSRGLAWAGSERARLRRRAEDQRQAWRHPRTSSLSSWNCCRARRRASAAVAPPRPWARRRRPQDQLSRRERFASEPGRVVERQAWTGPPGYRSSPASADRRR